MTDIPIINIPPLPGDPQYDEDGLLIPDNQPEQTPPWGKDEERIYAAGYEDGIAVTRAQVSSAASMRWEDYERDDDAILMQDLADIWGAFDVKPRPFPWTEEA